MVNPIEKIGFKRLFSILGLVVILLLALAFILGILSLRSTQEIISQDFQEQQLILARSTARQIEDGLVFLRRELRVLAYSPAIQYLETVAWANRMRVSFEDISRLGVTEIVRIDFDENQQATQAFILDAQGPRTDRQDYNQVSEVLWARNPENKGRFYQGPVQVRDADAGKHAFMRLATTVYQESVDESHPKAPGGLDGALIFTLDVSRFTANYCAGIRSGRTGYCWVLGKDGLFLYHPEKDFIGEDAFTARGRRNPVISFAKINEIQKSKMLAGEEGTSTYFSGWHRGVIREMEKFLAYTQAHVGPDCPYAKEDRVTVEPHGRPGCTEIWPVAVVAPTDEVWGTVRSLYFRQFLIQGVLIFALVFAAVAILYYELRWSVELQREVDRTTADLHRSREQYKSVVENARDLIFQVNDAGDFISANTATARAFGVPAKGVGGKGLADFFPPDDAATMLRNVRDVCDSRQSLEFKAATRIRDRVYWLSIHFVPIFGEDGRTVERVLIMARDITDRQRMEAQMAQTEKLASLGTLAAGVAHELNNPVGVMLGFAELLLDRVPSGSKEHELLKTIERQGLNAKRIVENLMSYARQPSKQEDFCDLNYSIEIVLELVKNNLLTRKIDLETRLAKGLPKVRGDASELQQVFLNLINNAVAAMPGGGRLTVVSKMNPYTHRVEAVFADTGTGISREIADRVFDPFFPTKKVGEGTGLGLAVSYAIVSKYGGDIRFESRAAGDGGGPTGTTFFVSLEPELTPSAAAEKRQAAN